MWTPKRIFLLILGFAMFLSVYLVYAVFLGGIDGLSPLPTALEQEIGGPPWFQQLNENEADRKLRQAFGPECPQVQKAIRLEVRKKGMVLAADNIKIEPDGRVKVTPCSVALFGKGKPNQKYPEINTIEGDVGLLTFDQPISNLTEIGTREVVSGELKGKIHIVNNRGTCQKSDDLEIRIDDEPLFYDKRQNRIWTEGSVLLEDLQTRPSTKITGKGMDLWLAHDNPHKGKEEKSKKEVKSKQEEKSKYDKKTEPEKRRGEPLGGVDAVVLRSWVEMHLYPESGSGFLGNPTKESPKPGPVPAEGAKKKPEVASNPPAKNKQDKSHVIIRTPGRFIYRTTEDVATFENVENAKLSDYVTVFRVPLSEKDEASKNYDQLFCDYLKLVFRPKEKKPAAVGITDTNGGDREIESAHAVARADRPLDEQVILTIDAEHLHAFCMELYYSAPTPTAGPRTLLLGSPVRANKDNHIIVAKELLLTGADPKGNGQMLEAQGPGQVDLFDQNNEKNHYPVHAIFKERMTATKDKQGDQIYDLLTLNGDSAFIDDEHAQELQGQQLKLWLEPADKTPPANEANDQKQNASTASRQRPWKLEATKNVRATSPDVVIHECRLLTVMFEDGILPLPTEKPGPKSPTNAETSPPVPPTLPTAPPTTPQPTVPGAPVVLQPPPTTAKNDPKTTPPEKANDKKPIHLWARDITTYVTRMGQKNQLREMVAEGSVKVRQDGKEIKDKNGKVVLDKTGKPATEAGVDIKGEILTLDRQSGGDILKVFAADPEHPAQVFLNDLKLLGPKVEIDQVKNTCYIKGPGAMELPSDKTFDGGKPTKPGTKLSVLWIKDMLFNGNNADFTEGVVAYQDNASLRCHTLQVQMDKFVSFKEGDKGGQGAKVEKMVANSKVFLVDTGVDEKGQLSKYTRLLAHQVDTDNLEGHSIVIGPLRIWSVQQSSGDDENPGAKPGSQPKAKKDKDKEADEWKLTHVRCEDQMYNNNKSVPKVSKFYGNVEVFSIPVDKKDRQIAVDWELEPDRIPKGGMYIKSDNLDVYTLTVGEGKDKKTNQEMEARKNVYFRTNEFSGRADMVRYNEKTETVVFMGLKGNTATLYRQDGPGTRVKTIRATTILYNRKTGEFSLEGGRLINWSMLHTKPTVDLCWIAESAAQARVE